MGSPHCPRSRSRSPPTTARPQRRRALTARSHAPATGPPCLAFTREPDRRHPARRRCRRPLHGGSKLVARLADGRGVARPPAPALPACRLRWWRSFRPAWHARGRAACGGCRSGSLRRRRAPPGTSVSIACGVAATADLPQAWLVALATCRWCPSPSTARFADARCALYRRPVCRGRRGHRWASPHLRRRAAPTTATGARVARHRDGALVELLSTTTPAGWNIDTLSTSDAVNRPPRQPLNAFALAGRRTAGLPPHPILCKIRPWRSNTSNLIRGYLTIYNWYMIFFFYNFVIRRY